MINTIFTYKGKTPIYKGDRIISRYYFQPYLLIITNDRIAVSYDTSNWFTASTIRNNTQGGAGFGDNILIQDAYSISPAPRPFYTTDYKNMFATSSITGFSPPFNRWEGAGFASFFPLLSSTTVSPDGIICSTDNFGSIIKSDNYGASFSLSLLGPGNPKIIRYLNSQFVTVQSFGSTSEVRISSTGSSFTVIGTMSFVSPTMGKVMDITYGNNLYVACSESGDFAYSSNLQTWTSSSSPTPTYYRSISYSPSLNRFVAVGNKKPGGSGGTSSISYSNNGTSWTAISTTTIRDRGWSSVTWVDDLSNFYAVSTKYIAQSSDGINWTENVIPGLSASGVFDCFISYVSNR
jgi:hypothetical protein